MRIKWETGASAVPRCHRTQQADPEFEALKGALDLEALPYE
jgi:hypothetical protein